MVNVDLNFLGNGKVSDLPANEVLQFNPDIIPKKPSKNQTSWGSDNNEFFKYWQTLRNTALSLDGGRDCYAKKKAAADGREASIFVGVDKIQAEKYSRRFTGYEEKYIFVREQLTALKDTLSDLGYIFKDGLQDPFMSDMKLLEQIVASMSSVDFNKFEPTEVSLIYMNG